MAHTRLVTRQREKAKKLAEKIIESDQEIEMQSQSPTQLQAQTHLKN